MKKMAFVATLVSAFMVLALCGCSQQTPSEPSAASAAPAESTTSQDATTSSTSTSADTATSSDTGITIDPNSLVTMRDVFEAPGEAGPSVYSDTRFAFAWTYDGMCYVVGADLPEGMAVQIEAVGDDIDALVELLNDVPVAHVGVYEIPTQEKLDLLVGATGADFVNGGFVFVDAYPHDNVTECVMTKGVFRFEATFDGALDMANPDALLGMTLKSMRYTGITDDLL